MSAERDALEVVKTVLEQPGLIEIMKARRKFSEDYARERGWPSDLAQLSPAQIMEIREQQGWKTPLVDGNQ